MAMLESPNTKLTIRPLAVTIGAEVSGIDLAKEQDDATIAEIRRALLDWKVLFFRDQDITTEQHLAFGRRFGPLEHHPFAAEKPGYPEVLAITHLLRPGSGADSTSRAALQRCVTALDGQLRTIPALMTTSRHVERETLFQKP